jgi:hypothetical protein
VRKISFSIRYTLDGDEEKFSPKAAQSPDNVILEGFSGNFAR